MNKKLELYIHLLLVWLLTIPVFVILICCIKDIDTLQTLSIPNELQWIFGYSCMCLVDIILISYNLITQRKKKIENIMIINILTTIFFTYLCFVHFVDNSKWQLAFLSIWQVVIFLYLKFLKHNRTELFQEELTTPPLLVVVFIIVFLYPLLILFIPFH